MKSETILDNDLSKVADVYISTEESADIENSKKIFPIK